MCSSKAKVSTGVEINQAAVVKFNGRPVLQPTCNRVPNHPPTLQRLNSLKKISQKSLPSPPPPPVSTSPRPPALKRGSDPNSLNSSSEKINVVAPKTTIKAAAACLDRKKSKSFKEFNSNSSAEASLTYSSSLLLDSPGSIAAVRREHMAFQHAQRKMRVAHYGRSKSAKFEPILLPVFPDSISDDIEDKRCSFITPNSDPIYVAYHDVEWGVPVHDDKLLFELLVLCGAQVGSDWTSILKKRQDFRNAFSDFEAEIVANITEKQMLSISTEYGIDISRVRGVVDNSKRILEIKKEFGSFAKYVWEFVNNKPISTQYKFGHKIQVKTSKSESISKDMVRRGFRLVGPTMVHSFMQAAGLTNDHLITCHRHLPCTLLAARRPLNQ